MMGKDKYKFVKENAGVFQAKGCVLIPSQEKFFEFLGLTRKEQKKLVQLKRRRWP